MSGKEGKVFRCSICGELEFGTRLPNGWWGCDDPSSPCTCQKCQKAMRLRDERRRQKETPC